VRGLRAAALLVLLAACAPGPEPPRTPVVLITLDTTRADALSCYGAPEGSSPRLDGLAAEGTRFDLAMATSSVTPVSHASILTGLDNQRHGVRVISAEGGFRLRPGVATLATLLRERGYSTAAVHSAFPVSAHYGFDRGFDVFESFEADFRVEQGGHFWDVRTFQRRSDETTDLALEWLAGTSAPYFLWVHYWDPHDGARLPPEEDLPADLPRGEGGWIPPSRELYAAEVRYMDRQIGRLLDGLRARGDWERALVVVVGDHGEGLDDHGWWGHRLLYQEQARVPLIVRAPGAEQGPSVDALVRTTDILPTVLDFLGVIPPEGVDGRSLRDLMAGRDDAPRAAFADQLNGYDLNSSIAAHRPYDEFVYAVVEDGWKLLWRPAHPERSELFDLAADPGEASDLYAERPDQAVRLKRLLAEKAPWVTAPFPPENHGSDLDAAQRALQLLGYTGGEGGGEGPQWAWTCPEHEDERSSQPRPCPRCGAPPLLIRAD
jgi:arylsulfatase A-like enzyme